MLGKKEEAIQEKTNQIINLKSQLTQKDHQL